MEIDKGSTISLSAENSLWMRLRTYRKTDQVMMVIQCSTLDIDGFGIIQSVINQ
jgi:hypothetical protein